MVLLNDFVRQWADVRDDVAAAVEKFGASGHYILGPGVAEFERRLALECKREYAVGVGNGLDALEIGLRAIGCGPGDRVLTTPLSAFATTLAILRAGAIPCFVDVDANGLVDLDLADQVLAQEPAIKAFVPVHLYGRTLNLGRLRALMDTRGSQVIEDCAQAIGATYGGIPAGTVGVAAALSFYPTKNLGCFGDGGALLTNDAALDRAARALRNYGQSARYVHDQVGLNSRLDEMQAHLLLAALLPRLQGWTDRRRLIASAYCRRITNPALELPSIEGPDGSGAVWHLFPVLVAQGERAAFQASLESRGVLTAVHYPTLISDQRALRDRGTFEILTPLVRAQAFASREVSLPIHPYMTEAEIELVVDACNGWIPT